MSGWPRHRGDGERDEEAKAVVAAAPAAQPAGRVDRGHPEPGHHVGGQQHVRDLVVGGPVEDDRPRVDGRDLALGQGEAAGLVHPRVGRYHRQRAGRAREHDRHPGPEVRPAGQPVPAIQVDGGEHGLQEEEHRLHRERDAERRAEHPHQAGPQQAHLEGQHRPGHRADRDQYGHHLGPAPGQQQRGLVMAP